MSDSVFSYFDPDWEYDTIAPDTMEFSREIESQVFSVLPSDEADLEFAELAPPVSRLTSKKPPKPVDEQWKDLGLDEFLHALQREQREAAPIPPTAAPPTTAGGTNEFDDEEDDS